ncbi:MAG: hypothetical protein EPN79_15995 [Burkholderiaceae bacterium]|nr:MAG: hypothetical protein EPN79_15995 [Burkholderiaceae bacterium]
MSRAHWVVLLIATASAVCASSVRAQSVINWPTQAAPPPSATASAAPEAPPLPPPLPSAQPATPVPAAAPLPTLTAGYVSHDGPEPNVRLDAGRVSPEVAAQYAQQPGESEADYVARMSAAYARAQAGLAASQAKNIEFIRSLAVPAGDAGDQR